MPLKRWLKNALDHVIHVCMNEPGLEFVWVGDDAVDPLEQAQTLQILAAPASRRARRRGRISGSGRRRAAGWASRRQGWGNTIRITTSAASSRRRTMEPDPWAVRRASRCEPASRSRAMMR